MARVHLFSPSPHSEKRRRISATTATTSTSIETNTTKLHTSSKADDIDELSRLAQLNHGPPPAIAEETNTLDITAVPSPSSTHTTSILHSPSLQQKDANNLRPPLPAASDIDLVSAFAAALSGKPESLQLIWDKIRRGSIGGDMVQRQDDIKDGKEYQPQHEQHEQQQHHHHDQQQQHQPASQQHASSSSEVTSTDVMEQEAAATALQLLGLASTSSEKRPSIDTGKTRATDSTSSNDEETANATAAAAAAVLRQALAHQQQHQQHHNVHSSLLQQQQHPHQQQLQQHQPHTDNNTNDNLNTLMANYPGLTSPSGSTDGLELQEDIMQDYKRGTWTREEDELLLMGIKKHGYGRWKEIANTIPGRKGKQLKQRWDNTLASKYVDRELLQNKLRHDEQIAKLQQHLEGLTSTTLAAAAASSSSTQQQQQQQQSNIITPSPAPPASQLNTQPSTQSGNNLAKPHPAVMHKVEQADWTEIAHKITEKVREGDQEAIEALLSQALLGTGHPVESHPAISAPVSSLSPTSSTNNEITTAVKQADSSMMAPSTETNTSTSRMSPQPSSEPPSDIDISYNRAASASTGTEASSTNANIGVTGTTSTSHTDVNNNINTTSSPSSQHPHPHGSVLNYADAAALSLYQQLSQQQGTADGDSNGGANPLATIQALANNQYFLSNLFANVENGTSDGTNAALAAAAAAAAAAMAHATAAAAGGANTDASSLLAATMRSHLTGNHGNTGGNGNMNPGDSNNANNTNNINIGNGNTVNNTSNTASDGESPSSMAKNANNANHHKRRRSDPALANTQSEAMSIYASSAPITTLVNNQPQTVYPCLFPNCGKAFARLYNLKSHSRTHTDDRPFCCQLCNTAFSRNHDLKRHLKTHVGEKPYKCGGCQKTFSRLDALKRHKSNARNQAVCLDT